VILKDVCEETRHHDAKAEIGKRPGGVLTAATATEVFSRDENLAFKARVVQDEICFRVSVAVVPPVAEQVFAKTFPRRSLKEARGNDLVGVDIFYGQRYCCTFQGYEFFLAHFVRCGLYVARPTLARRLPVL